MLRINNRHTAVLSLLPVFFKARTIFPINLNASYCEEDIDLFALEEQQFLFSEL